MKMLVLIIIGTILCTITDLMKNHCKVKFLEAAIAQSTYKGEIYAVPYGGLAGSGIFYNG